MPIKKKESKTIRNIKLKDRIDSLEQEFLIGNNTKNPYEELVFPESRKKQNISNQIIDVLFSYNFGLFLLIFFLLSVSILFNRFFLEKLDPKLFKIISASSSLTKNIAVSSRTIVFDQINKPYVVTLGEYGNLAIAKEEAIKLLPIFKQVNIRKLESGIYTFEIERFASKKKAYLLADEFMQKDFDAVHVRYLSEK